jgi:hypothetical protein
VIVKHREIQPEDREEQEPTHQRGGENPDGWQHAGGLDHPAPFSHTR